MPKKIDIIGQKFNMLTVLEECGHQGADRAFKCICDCGKEKIASIRNLRRGDTKSCGCAYKLAADKRNETPKHGHSRRGNISPEYRSYRMMVNRCTNPNFEQWKNYGGRGITVCARWTGEGGFENFLADMGQRPSKDHTLDRKKVNGNYEPDNCRWATWFEQAVNRRSTIFIEHAGETLCISDWERKLELPYMTIHSRVKWCRKFGMPLNMAIYPEWLSILEKYGPRWTPEKKQESETPNA